MPDPRLFRSRRNYTDFPQRQEFFLQCRQAGGINPVVIGKQNEQMCDLCQEVTRTDELSVWGEGEKPFDLQSLRF